MAGLMMPILEDGNRIMRIGLAGGYFPTSFSNPDSFKVKSGWDLHVKTSFQMGLGLPATIWASWMTRRWKTSQGKQNSDAINLGLKVDFGKRAQD